MSNHETDGGGISRLTLLAFALTAGAVVAAVLSGFGFRWQWWGLGSAFGTLKWSVYAAGIGLLLTIAAALRADGERPKSDGFALFVIAAVIGLALPSYVLNWVAVARSVPPIHDVSTNIDNPPAFTTLAARKDLRVPARRPELKKLTDAQRLVIYQRESYSDIRPLHLDITVSAATTRARDIAAGRGWEIAAFDADGGRLEATFTSRWYGFRDDVVVVVSADKGGSVVNMRSVSRIGTSDIGQNAKRIRGFLAAMASGD